MPHPERGLAVAYAPAARRAGFAALLALDDRLGAIVAAAREPIVGQMRLTWWHDALAALDEAPAPAEPLLRSIAADLLPHGVTGAALAAMIDGWERLLDPDALDADAYARERGGALFTLGARLLGGAVDDPALARAGEGWALAELARGIMPALPGVTTAAAARLAGASRWPRLLRPLGALARSAAMDLAGRTPGSPLRVARLLRLRLTGQ